MNPTTEYKILNAERPTELQQQVNQHIAQGWVPCGGVAACYIQDADPFNDQMIWAQAMTKATP